MPVIYDSKKLIPVPGINITKEYVRTGAGTLKKAQWKVSARGFLSVHKGSPDYNGDFWTSTGYPDDTPTIDITEDNRLAILRNKKGALSNLFAVPGKLFEIQSYDGSAPIKFIPRINTINFEEGNWFEYVKYSIEMETDSIFFGDIEQVADELGASDVQESWVIEQNDDKGRTYKITHTVSAQANDRYDPAGTGTIDLLGWELAKERVEGRLGFDATVRDESNTAITPSFLAYNHALQENIDETEGRYSITENWLMYDGGAYIEDYTITRRRSLGDGINNVSIEGNVTGFSTIDGFGDRNTNALAGWTTVQALLLTRAQTASGLTLNPNSVSNTVGANPNQGVITYNYEYNDRYNSTITNAINVGINVTDTYPADVFATHRVIARPSGPILQSIGTVTEQHRSLSIDVQMPPATVAGLATEPDSTEIAAIITAYIPSGAVQGPYVDGNTKSFSVYTGKYTRNVSWTWV